MNLAKNLATNISLLRKNKNMSQKQLADRAELPRSTLTHIESGSGNPSLSNLDKISGALNVSIEELLSRPRNECQLITASEIPKEHRSSGRVQISKLLPDKIRGLEIDKIEIDAQSTMPGHPHISGSKEYMTVLKGEIKVFVAGEQFTVKKGDVFAFPGNQPHSYRNDKNHPSEMISVVIPIPASV